MQVLTWRILKLCFISYNFHLILNLFKNVKCVSQTACWTQQELPQRQTRQLSIKTRRSLEIGRSIWQPVYDNSSWGIREEWRADPIRTWKLENERICKLLWSSEVWNLRWSTYPCYWKVNVFLIIPLLPFVCKTCIHFRLLIQNKIKEAIELILKPRESCKYWNKFDR